MKNLFKYIISFFSDLIKSRYLVIELTKRDFKNRYIGSALGFTWSIIQPFAMMFILWLILEVVFMAGPVRGVPFFAWLVMGLIPWYFFAESIPIATNVFHEYSYLVKKVNFRISILPIIKVLSALITHMIFLVFGIVIILITNIGLSFYNFQAIYYLFSMVIFVMSIVWITSTLQVFYKDVAQIITIVMQFGFWLTPIFWDSYNLVSPEIQYIFKLNPFFYIIDGYRRSFIYHTPVLQSYLYTIYFWIMTIIFLIIGVVLHKRLKSYFAEVL